jgi:hypothetical protein
VALCVEHALSRRTTLCRVCQLRELFDVVQLAEQFPLPIDFSAVAHPEPREAFVVADVAEHGLDQAKAPVVLGTRVRFIDARLHAFGVGGRRFPRMFCSPTKEHNGAHFCSVRVPETATAMFARHAVPLRAPKLLAHIVIDHEVLPLAVQRFAGRADARPRRGIVAEVGRRAERKGPSFALRGRLVV